MNPDESPDGTVTELTFEVNAEEFVLAEASERAGCELQLEAAFPRSDGSVLEYLSVSGADPDRVLALFSEAPDIVEARLLGADGEDSMFELVSESHVAAAIVDGGSALVRIRARAGNGYVKAEVPPHVDAGKIISGFLEQYPSANLVARRQTDRTVPAVTADGLRDRLFADFTDRQIEALRVAHEGGYFGWPRERTTEEVAADLGVSPSTLSQHLRVAERKLLDALFED